MNKQLNDSLYEFNIDPEKNSKCIFFKEIFVRREKFCQTIKFDRNNIPFENEVKLRT